MQHPILMASMDDKTSMGWARLQMAMLKLGFHGQMPFLTSIVKK